MLSAYCLNFVLGQTEEDRERENIQRTKSYAREEKGYGLWRVVRA